MREENFWYKKPRYSEVRVITRRVIARYDCRCFYRSPQTLNTESYITPLLQALELAAKNVVAIVGPGSTSVAVHLASLMGTLTCL